MAFNNPDPGTSDEDRTEIVLTWDAPDNPEGAPVTKYTIRWSSNGRSYGHLKDLSPKDAKCATDTDCTYTDEKLLENTERWYRVYATNSVGTSKASLSDDGMTSVGETPNPPEGLRAGLTRNGRMVLYWDAPTETDTSDRHEPAGALITRYYVQGAPVASITGTTFVPAPTDVKDEDSTSRLYDAGANTSVPLTSSNVLGNFRQPNTDDAEVWGFRVAAVNRVVERNLSDGTIDTNDLEWTDVIVRVNHRARDLPPVPETKDEAGEVVAAVPNAGDDMVERPKVSGKKVSNVNGGRTSIDLEWEVGRNEESDDGVNETRFWLEYSTDGIDWKVITTDAAGTTDLTATHENRVAGMTYHYRVFAKHENDTVGEPENSVRSEASSEATVKTAPADTPDAPDFISAEPESEEEIELEWTAPGPTDAERAALLTSAGYAAVGYGKITAYKVEVSEDGTNWSPLVEIEDPKEDLTYTWDSEKNELSTKAKTDNGMITLVHAGLSQGETKYYRVSTVNNAATNKATSVPSNGLKATTDGSLKADSPGGLVVKAEGLSVIKLLWNARAPDIAAAPVTGYKIEVSSLNSDGDDCAEQWSDLVEDTMSTTTSYDHTGLMPDTGRCYRVSGINDVAVSTSFVGYGDPYPATKDNDAIATTDEAPPNAAPMAVGMIAPVSVTMGQMTAAMDVSSYFSDADMGDTLTYTAMSDMEMYATADIPADSSMLTITGVAAGTATITVTATDSMGAMATQEIMVTVEAADTTLTAPSDVLVSTLANTQSVSVTWDTTSIQNAEQIKVVLFNSDVTALAQITMPLITINPANDAGSATFNDVPDGTYYVTVASFRTGERHKLSSLQEVTVE